MKADRFSTRTALVLATALLGSAWALGRAHADEGKPAVIRIANPGVGIGGRPVVAYGPWSLLHIKGTLEQEFKADGIPVQWTFVRSAGPGVNELFANGLADITLLGDLPSIIAKSSGLKTRLLASAGLSPRYLAVLADSQIHSIKDLVGKKLALTKGTCNHLSANRILEGQGLKEQDVRMINMDNITMLNALTTGDIDSGLGGPELLSLRDRGIVRIIYDTKNDAQYTCNSTIIVSDEFARKYPSIVKRILRQHVLISKWFTEHEKNPSEIYQLFTKSGVPFSAHKEDWGGTSFSQRASPLIDPYLRARYTGSIQDASKFKLIRGTFDFNTWIDTSFLDQILQEEKLVGYWPQRPAL